uniref:Uncharacterized protein n=1 Tax=Anguilla anguilla TaxID=7936 RepID=A0A0E9QKE3_ANGAN
MRRQYPTDLDIPIRDDMALDLGHVTTSRISVRKS